MGLARNGCSSRPEHCHHRPRAAAPDTLRAFSSEVGTVRVKKTRQMSETRAVSDSTKSETALSGVDPAKSVEKRRGGTRHQHFDIARRLVFAVEGQTRQRGQMAVVFGEQHARTRC